MSSVFKAEPLFTTGPSALSFRTMTRLASYPLFFPLLAALLLSAQAFALPAVSPTGEDSIPLSVTARSAILIDQATGRVLFAHNADMPLPPASLAKLMTLHIVYQKLEDRSIGLDDVVAISPNAWALNQVPGSSLMLLEPGHIVTVGELMKGMAVASGNDAAIALAEYVAGSKEKFVRLMNEECRFMGYKNMIFTDPAGVEKTNVVNALEFADFCRRYIDLHPQSLSQLLSLREFEYPLPQNLPVEWPKSRKLINKPVKQYNGNFLVWDGIDGLKTGHLDERNFTAAVTIKRGDMRLIAVILGAAGRTLMEGSLQRAMDCMTLLSWGFRTFTAMTPDISPLKPIRVWKGAEETVPVVTARPLAVAVRESEADSIAYSVIIPSPPVAPVRKGQKIGELIFSCGEEEIGRYDLLAQRDVEPSGFFKRVWDTVMMGVGSLLGVTG